MLIKRFLEDKILKYLQPNKVVVIYGPRQAGKTTLLKQILPKIKEDYLLISGEDRLVKEWLGSQSLITLKANLGNKTLLVIDEAQKIDQIGLNLKILIDGVPGLKIIATGSSSFELANQVGEPLVGRQWPFMLYPIAQLELSTFQSPYEAKAQLPERLIFGSYPAVINLSSYEEKKQLLNTIVDNYLYRDLLEYEGIKKSQKILSVLRLIAFQIGHEVSLNEVGGQVSLNLRTVERYLDLLEKAFVLKRVYGFSRNLRKELTKNSRFYFFDNGVRNALINNFNSLEVRDDLGALWENYLFMERMKKQEYQPLFANNYFWRTYTRQEIDLVEEREGKFFGFEFKWGSKKVNAPSEWLKTYPNAVFEVINKENYLSFIT